jgi:phospholipid/cholesterol/gamma-HCH transport system substrate-binding protein
MNRQAQVGLFTILGLIAVFAVFYVLEDIGARSQGYKIGVHFRAASGLRNGAYVYLSGVPIGAVDQITLLPDYSTEVILAIKPPYEIPQGSKFLIQAPITGEPTVLIEPPLNVSRDVATLPHEVLPVDQQPRGTNPTSFADLLEQGQGEVRRLDDLLAELQKAEPGLLAELQSTLHNANSLTTNANASLTKVTAKAETLADSLQQNLTIASTNVVALTGSLNSVVQRDSGTIDILLAQLTHTSKSFSETVDSLHDIATNPKVKQNLIDTTRDFAVAAKAFAALTNDIRNVTGNPATQQQLRDTVAQLDATSQKVDSLVGQLGGTSAVYGIDKGAPAPTPLPSGFVRIARAARAASVAGSRFARRRTHKLESDRDATGASERLHERSRAIAGAREPTLAGSSREFEQEHVAVAHGRPRPAIGLQRVHPSARAYRLRGRRERRRQQRDVDRKLHAPQSKRWLDIRRRHRVFTTRLNVEHQRKSRRV